MGRESPAPFFLLKNIYWRIIIMAFTAADVKNLREMTGVGMMDCKKALTECDGNMDIAIELGKGKNYNTTNKR